MKKLREHHISFKNAINGLRGSFSSQPNFAVHFILSAFVLFLAWFLRIETLEILVIFMVIVFGLGAEMINTAIQAMTDMITREWKQEAKIAKDVAAGMMLLYAIGAFIAGAFIFPPCLAGLILENNGSYGLYFRRSYFVFFGQCG